MAQEALEISTWRCAEPHDFQKLWGQEGILVAREGWEKHTEAPSACTAPEGNGLPGKSTVPREARLSLTGVNSTAGNAECHWCFTCWGREVAACFSSWFSRGNWPDLSQA